MADDILDTPSLSARDVLLLVRLVRETGPRDGLRALEDRVLDMVARAGA